MLVWQCNIVYTLNYDCVHVSYLFSSRVLKVRLCICIYILIRIKFVCMLHCACQNIDHVIGGLCQSKEIHERLCKIFKSPILREHFVFSECRKLTHLWSSDFQNYFYKYSRNKSVYCADRSKNDLASDVTHISVTSLNNVSKDPFGLIKPISEDFR